MGEGGAKDMKVGALYQHMKVCSQFTLEMICGVMWLGACSKAEFIK